MTRSELDATLLAAHAAGDGARIGQVYAQAADTAMDKGEAAFFLTQAYIFALEAGCTSATGLRDRLVALGAER